MLFGSNEAYDNGANAIAAELAKGKEWCFLCERCPLFLLIRVFN